MIMHTKSREYQKKALNTWLFRMGMLRKLPSVFFWGIRIIDLTTKASILTIPYNWKTQNPFSSMYFAALAGAAELSTGALCQLHLADRTPHSMLVTNFTIEYVKKANTLITLTCEQGDEVEKFLNGLTQKGDSGRITLISEAINSKQELVATAKITWSIMRK